MTEWIEHTTGRCPVDPETVVEVLLPGHTQPSPPRLATLVNWRRGAVAYYRIITPAKPPEPEMTKTAQERAAAMVAATKPEPDLITLRLECLKLAATLDMAQILGAHVTFEQVADIFLHYVLNGSVDKA
jgi:hypothetical protein